MMMMSQLEHVFVLIHEQIRVQLFSQNKKYIKDMMLHSGYTKTSIKIDHMYLMYYYSQKLFILKPIEVKTS